MSFPRMHVSIYVSNLDRSVEFYDKFFAVSAAKVRAGYAKWILNSPSLIFSIIENPELAHAQFGHLGFQVETQEALEIRMDLCKQSGLDVREEMGTNCCYALQDKFWVADPDGFQWEVYLFREDAEFNDPHSSSGGISTCCLPSDLGQSKPKSTAFNFRFAEDSCKPGSGCCG